MRFLSLLANFVLRARLIANMYIYFTKLFVIPVKDTPADPKK